MSDFLSRQKHDSDPHDIIPISFNMYNVLHENYYNLGKDGQIFSANSMKDKSSGIKLPEVHGVKKILNINTLPEKQKTAPLVKKSIKINQE